MKFRREGRAFDPALWVLGVALVAAFGVWLGVFFSPWAGAAFVVLQTLLRWVRKRPRFVDVGRFCAGAWRPLHDEGHLLALGFTRYGERGPWSGLQLTLGTFAFAVFAILPRAEWAEHKRVLADDGGEEEL
ncbi:hypothetical protein [Streptomyces anulatus]|uniref:hypothetical protein n=1 Tax=Streptomyces anulatus TaxID=1892 RepID=UPI0037DBFE4C|nr:hypothetical protein OHB50_39455 [Streptomyces anulatus]